MRQSTISIDYPEIDVTPHIRSIHVLQRLIDASENIVITTHVNPDGDAIGSSCGLYNALKVLGKNVSIINTSRTPDNFLFLVGSDAIEVYSEPLHYDLLKNADLLIVLDLNTPKRTDTMEYALRTTNATVVMIDHHLEPDDFYSVAIHDVDATSTCELIWKFLKVAFPQTITKDVAECLYTGLMTDTGNFRFSRVTAMTHQMIVDILNTGVSPNDVYEHVMNTNSRERTMLYGAALSGMTFYFDGKICVMTVTQEMFLRYNSNQDDTDGFVNSTLSMDGVVCGVFIKEHITTSDTAESTTYIKVSLRSKGDISAREIAVQFGGGGHFNAAAARIFNKSVNEVVVDICKALEPVLTNLP